MKPIVLALSTLLLGSTAFAERLGPNLYQCRGTGVTASYSTTSIAGKPVFSVQQGTTTTSRRGDQIQTQNGHLGTLVTVTKAAVPDLNVVTLTVIVPAINLSRQTAQVTFDTYLFETTSRTSIAGPALVQGLVQRSTLQKLSCTAKRVIF
jgi:hypothetical protein